MLMKVTIHAILLVFTSTLSIAAYAHADAPKHVDIPAGELSQALLRLSKQYGADLVYRPEQVYGLKTHGAHGELTTEQAVTRLLQGTTLELRTDSSGAMLIAPPVVGTTQGTDAPEASNVASDDSKEGKNSSSKEFRLAQVDQGANPQSSAVGSNVSGTQENENKGGLEEILVTATKRSERLQDVPISIAVVGADEISERDLVGAADYLRAIPGVNQVESGGYGGQAIVIRGIATDTQSQNIEAGATTATYFGEIPTTTSAGFEGSSADLKLVDIERVEVLRGPQGTSFGDSSLGGAVRTIPVAPNLDVFEGKLAAGQSETAGFGGGNDDFQAVLNIPLIEGTLAIRAVAYKFTDSGYYRNFAGSNAAFQQSTVIPYGVSPEFAHDEAQVGSSNTWGGRIAALYQVSNDLKFTVTYITQRTTEDGFGISTTQTPYGQALFQVAPEQVVDGRDAGGAYYVTNLANVVGEYNLGWATLVGTYSYITAENHDVVQYAYFGINQPVSLESGPSSSPTHRQNVGELRAVSRLAGPWNFVAGLYVDDQADFSDRTYYWYGDPATNPYAPGKTSLGFFDNLEQLTQKAAFGEVTWELLPGLTLLGGARYYDYHRDGSYVEGGGGFFPSATTTLPFTPGDASGFIGRGSLSYKLTADALLYASWSQGFRIGAVAAPVTATECQCSTNGVTINGTSITLASTGVTKSDSVTTYEVGGKFALLNRRLAIDADYFLTDWSNVPLEVTTPNGLIGYTTNAGNARVSGIELQAKYQLSDALRIDLGGSYIDSHLTQVDPNVTDGAVGDRLPGSPKINGNLGAQYAFHIADHAASLRVDTMYVGSFYGDIQESSTTKSGGYATINATARIVIKEMTVDLYAHNLTDRDSYTFRPQADEENFGFRLQPRTIGVQLAYSF